MGYTGCVCGNDKDDCVDCMKDYIRRVQDDMVKSFVAGYWQGRTDHMNGQYPTPHYKAKEYFEK